MPILRKAMLSDAGPLAALAERTFRDTFEATNTAEDMALHCRDHYSEPIQSQEILDPGVTTLVCEHDGALIAFAQLRRDPAPLCVRATRPCEIQRLYVTSAWHGKGLAPELMRRCLAQAEEEGADQVWLGVWEHNPPRHRLLSEVRVLGGRRPHLPPGHRPPARPHHGQARGRSLPALAVVLPMRNGPFRAVSHLIKDGITGRLESP